MEQLTQLIKQHAVGDEVAIRVIRDGKTVLDLKVVLKDSKSQTKPIEPQQPQKRPVSPFGQ